MKNTFCIESILKTCKVTNSIRRGVLCEAGPAGLLTLTVIPTLDAAQLSQRSQGGLHPKNWGPIHVSGTATLLYCCLLGFPGAGLAESYRTESELHLASSVILTEWSLSLKLHFKYWSFVLMKRSGERESVLKKKMHCIPHKPRMQGTHFKFPAISAYCLQRCLYSFWTNTWKCVNYCEILSSK